MNQSLFRFSAMFPALILSAACTGGVPSSLRLTKEYVENLPRDTAEETAVCAELGREEGCDLCDAFDWYSDGACDTFCRGADPDCVRETCGGILGTACAEGYVCVDDPSDDCEAPTGADCIGICVADEPPPPPPSDVIVCGGFLGLACPDGFECLDDPSDDCDPLGGGADCSGICSSLRTL